MEALLFLLCVAGFAGFGLALAAYFTMRSRVEMLERKLGEHDSHLARLTQRVFTMETRPAQPRLDEQPEAPAPEIAEPPPAVEPVVPDAAPRMPRYEFPAQPTPGETQPPPPSAPAPPERDLEAVIGSNWLSKLGVVILLIGIALFVGFSLTAMGPLGRVLTGVGVSLALLGAGVAAERKEDYRTLGRALIGGGWAGLYFSVFAAHGLDAARVIHDPALGFVLLLAVAAGMIGHSLRYRNQTVTGMAFAAAFLTVAISSLTKFSAIASIPLLLALLIAAWRFRWQPLAIAGAALAYLAYGFDLASGDKDRYFILIGEPVLWIYWLILEAYDIAVLRRFRSEQRGGYLPVSPMNLTGFLLATAAVWPTSGWKPDPMLVSMAVAQLLSAVLRGRRLASGELADDSLLGGYRAAITFSTAFSAAYLIDAFSGLRQVLSLALLGEGVIIAGWMYRSVYLKGLGGCLLLVAAYRSLWGPYSMQERWWPSSFTVLAGLGLVNRTLLGCGPWYSIVAALLLIPVLTDFQTESIRAALLTAAAGGIGLLLRWREKPEAKGVGIALAFVAAIVLLWKIPADSVWVTIGLPALLYVAFGWVMKEGLTRVASFSIMHVFVCALLYRLLGNTQWLLAAVAALALAAWVAGWLSRRPSLAAFGLAAGSAGGRSMACLLDEQHRAGGRKACCHRCPARREPLQAHLGRL
jgi:hypothetical protein